MNKYLEVFVSSFSESVVFAAICAAVALVGTFILGVSFPDGFGFVLLVVSAGLMLIGGALSFVTPGKVRVFNMLNVNVLRKQKVNMTKEDYSRSENRAALYSLTGVLLFAYSLLLAVLAV